MGQSKQMPQQEDRSRLPAEQDDQWALAPTPPERAQAVRDRLAAHGITDEPWVSVILNILDSHGLFHEPRPAPMTTSQKIRRNAQVAMNRLRKRIEQIRKGQAKPQSDREARLAEHWEQCGEATLQLEKLKVESQTFQTLRGGRIIARHPDTRVPARKRGRRPEVEVTHALQLLDRFLRDGKTGGIAPCDLTKAPRIRYTGSREEVLADILSAAMNLAVSPEQVHFRLQSARRTMPLADADYRCAIGALSDEDIKRMQTFKTWMLAECDPTINEEEKERLAAIYAPMFRIE